MPEDVGFGSSSARRLYRYDPMLALRHLRRDPDMRALIRRVGPFAMESRAHLTAFQALLRSIVYQQLSGRAAARIESRLKGLFPHRRPSAARLLALSDESLRECGLSRAKILAARDLSRKTLSGTLPHRGHLAALDDEAIIALLTDVRGIGRWSAQMLLIFNMGRPDVLPVDDLGVRRGFMLLRGEPRMPAPAELETHGERWRPFRSVASWYLWRASELSWPAPSPSI